MKKLSTILISIPLISGCQYFDKKPIIEHEKTLALIEYRNNRLKACEEANILFTNLKKSPETRAYALKPGEACDV